MYNSICPNTGRMIVIEMNPRVSRSSALVSKQLESNSKIALLAVDLHLMRLQMILLGTAASFEPVIDYIVTKFLDLHLKNSQKLILL